MSKQLRRRYPHIWNEAVQQFIVAHEGNYVPDLVGKITLLYRRMVRDAKEKFAQQKMFTEKSPG